MNKFVKLPWKWEIIRSDDIQSINITTRFNEITNKKQYGIDMALYREYEIDHDIIYFDTEESCKSAFFKIYRLLDGANDE